MTCAIPAAAVQLPALPAAGANAPAEPAPGVFARALTLLLAKSQPRAEPGQPIVLSRAGAAAAATDDPVRQPKPSADAVPVVPTEPPASDPLESVPTAKPAETASPQCPPEPTSTAVPTEPTSTADPPEPASTTVPTGPPATEDPVGSDPPPASAKLPPVTATAPPCANPAPAPVTPVKETTAPAFGKSRRTRSDDHRTPPDDAGTSAPLMVAALVAPPVDPPVASSGQVPAAPDAPRGDTLVPHALAPERPAVATAGAGGGPSTVPAAAPAPHMPKADPRAGTAPAESASPAPDPHPPPVASQDPAATHVAGPNPPASSPLASGPEAHPAVSPSPAAQLAPALVSLTHTSNGAQRLTVQLQPPELGPVTVQVDRHGDAPVRVEITVQRPETLALLVRDQPQLQQALTQAGLPGDGRSVTLHLAPPPPAATAHGSASFTAVGGGGSSQGGGQPSPHPPRWDAAPDVEEHEAAQPIVSRWLRAGLDITA